tara:strand:- start:28 stop:417 length:390 start_codon:yes stop_codon:yes gene_type:complete
MNAETPEEFWYQNIAKYSTPPEPKQSFPSNVVVEQLTKTKKSEICIFEGYLKNGDSILLTYPRNASLDGTIVVKNFIGMGVGECDYDAQIHVVVYDLDYNKPMTDEFFLSLLQDSYGWEIKDYGDLSIY